MFTKSDIEFSVLGTILIINVPFQKDPKFYVVLSALYKSLKDNFQTDIHDITSTFNSINLFFKSEFNVAEQSLRVLDIFDSIDVTAENNKEATLWEIPVCMDKEYTIDLYTLFKQDHDKVKLYLDHFLSLEYRLVFYGFLPGFGYLSGLPDELSIPRKTTPNRLTKKGSLAIGGEQVGVYPQNSPGGWHVIGNCPIPWIDFKKDPPTFIEVGDRVRFVKISTQEFNKITQEQGKGNTHFNKALNG